MIKCNAAKGTRHLLLLLTLSLILGTAYSQTSPLNKRISVNFKHERLDKVLKRIGLMARTRFSYSSDIIPDDRIITYRAKNKTVRDILDQVFEDPSVRYKVIENQIVLYKIEVTEERKSITISGFVRSSASNENLVSSAVFEPNTGKGTYTNGYGFYSLSLPNPGDSVEIVYRYLGYEPRVISLHLDQDTTINMSLTPIEYQAKAVKITDEEKYRLQKNVQMSSFRLYPGEVENMPAVLGEPNLIRSLQMMPGVQRGTTAANGMYVRGGGPDQNLVLLDDAVIYNTTHMFNIVSVFNTDAIKSVEMIKGGFPARYGGRLSSVLDLRMKEGNMKDFEVTGAITPVAPRLTIEGPIVKDKASFILSGRRTFLDLLFNPIIGSDSDDDVRISQDGAFYDFSGKINTVLGDFDRLYLSTYGSGDGFSSLISTRNQFSPDSTYNTLALNMKSTNNTATFRWNHIFNQKLFLNTTLVYSKFNFNISLEDQTLSTQSADSAFGTFFNRFESSIRDYSTRLDFDYHPNIRHKIRFGAYTTFHQFTPGVTQFQVINPNEEVDSLFSSETTASQEFATYIEDEIHFTDNFATNTGVHFAMYGVNGKSYFSLQPRISMRYRFEEDFAIKAAFSNSRQYVHLLSNSRFGLPFNLWVPATDSVPPMNANQLSVGVVKSFGKEAYTISAEVYYKLMDNLIEYKEGSNFLDSRIDWQNKIDRDGKGTSYGLELLLEKRSGRTTGLIGYTLSFTNRQFSTVNLGEQYPYTYDRRHDVSLYLKHNLNKHVYLSGTWVFATGNALTFPTSTYINNNYPNPNGQPVYYYPGRNQFRMPSYHRMDVGIDFYKKLKRGEQHWNFSIANVYAKKNAIFIYPTSDASGNRILEQISLPFPVPSVAYIFKFK